MGWPESRGRTIGLVGVALFAVLSLAGCAAGPDYRRPLLTLDKNFVNVGAASTDASAVGADLAAFWRGFGDATLDRLVERAVAANGDVRVAQARLQEARANEGVADAEGLPTVGAQADATRAVIPKYQFPALNRKARTYSGYDASFVANWELDLFGRAKRGREAAAAVTAATEAGLAATYVSVSAETARNYLALRGLQERYRVTEESLANQRESRRITHARFEAGRATQLDVARANELVESTEAILPALQASVDLAIYRLATLTAQSPRAMQDLLAKPAPLPGLPVTDLSRLPIGTPEGWLMRRPDLIAAERQVAAATANVGVARADLFPRVTLSGLLGLASGGLATLSQSDSLLYSAGAGMSWTLLDFGRIRGRIGAGEARAQQALAAYEQAVALALEETEGAMAQFTRNTQRVGKLALAARSAGEAVKLARLRYETGVTDFLAVLDAEREALSTQDQLAQSRSDTAAALVAVYRSLGGGWNAPAGAAAPTGAVSGAVTTRTSGAVATR
jgi:outer membrane protein, multidrug efflux system